MAKLTRLQLQDKVANNLDNARQELFDYASVNSLLPRSLNPAQQRVYFETQVEGMTSLAQAWIGSYLPMYNAANQGWLSQRFPDIPLGDRAKGALGVGAAAVAAGLVGLVVSAGVDNEAAKDAIQLSSKAAIYSSPLLAMAAYASNFVNDQGKKAMTKVGAVAVVSVLALLTSQGMDNETLKGTLELSSYTGLAGSGIGTLVNLVKYHR